MTWAPESSNRLHLTTHHVFGDNDFIIRLQTCSKNLPCYLVEGDIGGYPKRQYREKNRQKPQYRIENR